MDHNIVKSISEIAIIGVTRLVDAKAIQRSCAFIVATATVVTEKVHICVFFRYIFDVYLCVPVVGACDGNVSLIAGCRHRFISTSEPTCYKFASSMRFM